MVEAAARLGGKLVTQNLDGFVIDGAADGFLARKSPALDWALQLGLGPLLIEPRPEHRFSHVLWNGTLHRMPEGFTGLVPTDPQGLRKSTLLTPEAIERAVAEGQVPPQRLGGEESVSAFFSRRYGAEAFERLMEPLLSGIFAGDADQLSAEAAFPQLVALEKQGLSLQEGLASGVRGPGGPAFRSFSGGMAAFPSALEAAVSALGVVAIKGQTVTRVDSGPRGFTVHTAQSVFAADAVILAVPPRAAGSLVSELSSPLAATLSDWPVTSVANLHLAFDASQVPDLPAGSGFVAPAAGKTAFSAATWSSQKWPGRAPSGRVLLRFYFGGARDVRAWKTPESEMLETALSFLKQFQRGGAPQPLWHRVFRWPQAFAQPNVGHAQRHGALESASLPGLFLAGGYFAGVGIPDCLARADEAARQASLWLGLAPRPPFDTTRQRRETGV